VCSSDLKVIIDTEGFEPGVDVAEC